MYLNRYLLLQQRVRRNPKFCRPAFGGLGGDQRHFVEVGSLPAFEAVPAVMPSAPSSSQLSSALALSMT